jgi:hypothetical protein
VAIKSWYPLPDPGDQGFAEAFDLGDRNTPGARAALMHIPGAAHCEFFFVIWENVL